MENTHSIFNIQYSRKRGFTPTPTSTLFRFFEIGLNKFVDSAQEIFLVKNYSETKKLRQRWCRGFTAVEILTVIAILGLLMAITIPSLTKFRQNSLLNGDTLNIITMINKARTLSVADKADQQYGVHFETGKVVVYQGATYTAGAPTNETFMLSKGLTLSGTASEILFAKVTGVASQTATVNLLVTGTTSSTTIAILSTGIATQQ